VTGVQLVLFRTMAVSDRAPNREQLALRPSIALEGAAVWFAKVWMLVRGRDLAASMSRYLVDRIEGLSSVEVVRKARRCSGTNPRPPGRGEKTGS
jgi:hypothetical protein